MLELHFINVGDGDAILIEDRNGGDVFRMLVDAGRRVPDAYPGSPRRTAAAYLREKEISRLDVLVVTHLHVDHYGGVADLLSEVDIGEVCSGFFPDGPGMRIPPEPEAVKTVRGMIDCVNEWAEITDGLRAAGVPLRAVSASIPGLRLTERLTADLICPNEIVCALQGAVWRALLSGEQIPDDVKYLISKTRNPNALRLRLRYAGRRVELPADCYAAVWENEDALPCDILKVPHHGAPGAVSEKLLEKLRPRYAVISCEAAYSERKDRPSRRTAELLERYGVRYWFTDCFSADWHAPTYWSSVDFTICDDGTILAPDGR